MLNREFFNQTVIRIPDKALDQWVKVPLSEIKGRRVQCRILGHCWVHSADKELLDYRTCVVCALQQKERTCSIDTDWVDIGTYKGDSSVK